MDLLLQVQSRDQAIAELDDEIKHRKLREDKLTQLRRYRYGKGSEALDGQKLSMLDDIFKEEIAAIETALE